MSKGSKQRPTDKAAFDAAMERIKASQKCNPNKETGPCDGCNCYLALRKGK